MNDCISTAAVQHNAEVARSKIPMIEIPKAEYDQLLSNSLTLNALEAHGVDNWEWFGDAIASLNE